MPPRVRAIKLNSVDPPPLERQRSAAGVVPLGDAPPDCAWDAVPTHYAALLYVSAPPEPKRYYAHIKGVYVELQGSPAFFSRWPAIDLFFHAPVAQGPGGGYVYQTDPHRRPMGSDAGTPAEPYSIVLSEGVTGQCVAWGATRSAALTALNSLMMVYPHWGRDILLERVRRAALAQGVSPRWLP